MEPWLTLWTLLLAGGLLIFAGVAIAVAIGGLGDIRAMLAGIRRHHDEAMEKGKL